ncbi:MAG: DMT family transporter [Steroidobacteraceae bacterium]
MTAEHHSQHGSLSGATAALLSALLFGVTTPVAKQLLTDTSSLLIAGLLYAGSGLGLTLLILVQDHGHFTLGLARPDKPWLAAAVVSGGVLAPALLMFGLSHADAAAASLLLNLEAVFTAAMAWLFFHEATSRRVVWGFIVIFVGSFALVWPSTLAGKQTLTALGAIAAACACWAADNNFTRKISAGDARAIAAIKGLAAGATNVGLAFALHAAVPPAGKLWGALALGFLGYGMSLVLFIYSLRNLGTARTSAYFATAPFIGSAVSILMYGQPIGWPFWIAAICMAIGVWLHLTEDHEHEHLHEPLVHSHAHSHDSHHQHEHERDRQGSEPHVHEHRHEPLRHRHPHFPDIHHQHSHR